MPDHDEASGAGDWEIISPPSLDDIARRMFGNSTRWDEIIQALEWMLDHDFNRIAFWDESRQQYVIRFNAPEGDFMRLLEIADERLGWLSLQHYSASRTIALIVRCVDIPDQIPN